MMMRRLLTAGFLLPLGAVLLVLGAKLALIDALGSDVPVGEQWTVEGSTLFQVKLHRGHVPAEHFFFPSGEHRPATARLWAYALYRLDGGQWDCRVQAVANLVFQAGTVLLLWLAAAAFARGPGLIVARVFTVLICALPANHENFAWGFQSQFLLCILCGLLHIYGTTRATQPDWRWGLAQVAGFVGLLSLASGLLSAVALVGLALLELVHGRRGAWVWLTLLANGALAGFGYWFAVKVGDSPNHAHSVGDFLKAFGVLLSWPAPGGWGILSHLPFVIALVVALRRPSGPGPGALFLGLAAWFWLLLAALAFGRGGGEMSIAVRYFDMLVIGCWLNVAAVLWLGQSGWPRAAMAVLALSLLPMLGWLGYWNRPAGIRSTVETVGLVARLRDDVVRDFLKTDDPAVFKRYDWLDSRFPHLPYTIEILRDPLMRPALPPSLQADGRAGGLSRAAAAAAGGWRWVLAAGVVMLAAGGWRRRVAAAP